VREAASIPRKNEVSFLIVISISSCGFLTFYFKTGKSGILSKHEFNSFWCFHRDINGQNTSRLKFFCYLKRSENSLEVTQKSQQEAWGENIPAQIGQVITMSDINKI